MIFPKYSINMHIQQQKQKTIQNSENMIKDFRSVLLKSVKPLMDSSTSWIRFVQRLDSLLHLEWCCTFNFMNTKACINLLLSYQCLNLKFWVNIVLNVEEKKVYLFSVMSDSLSHFYYVTTNMLLFFINKKCSIILIHILKMGQKLCWSS